MKLPTEALDAYFETALWSSTEMDELNTPLDENYDVNDISPELRAEAEQELADFIKLAGHLLGKQPLTLIAHDFWLTRCGHGAGFWDGDYEHGEELTKLCKPYGNVDLYVGDDNLIHSM